MVRDDHQLNPHAAPDWPAIRSLRRNKKLSLSRRAESASRFFAAAMCTSVTSAIALIRHIYRGRKAPGTETRKRSNSAAELNAFYPLSWPEAGFPQNRWRTGARNAGRKTYDFPAPPPRRHLSVVLWRFRKRLGFRGTDLPLRMGPVVMLLLRSSQPWKSSRA